MEKYFFEWKSLKSDGSYGAYEFEVEANSPEEAQKLADACIESMQKMLARSAMPLPPT